MGRFNIFKRLIYALLLSYGLTFGFNVATTHNLPRESTVLIVTADERSNGSGVVIGPGLILTARHVAEVAKNQPLHVKIDGKDVPLTLVALDPNADLGLLQGDFSSPTADVADRLPQVGDAVDAVGFPAWVYVHDQIKTSGEVQSASDSYIRFTGDIAPGNSGGGLFHQNWLGKTELVGINVRVNVLPLSMFSVQLMTYMPQAVSTDMIRLFLENYKTYPSSAGTRGYS